MTEIFANLFDALGTPGIIIGVVAFCFIGLVTSGRMFKNRPAYAQSHHRKAKLDLAILAISAINLLLLLTIPEEGVLKVWVLFAWFVFLAELVLNVIWASIRPDGRFTVRLVGHLLLWAIISLHFIAATCRVLCFSKSFLLSWFGSFFAGWAYLLPLTALFILLYKYFERTFAYGKIAAAIAIAIVFIICLIGCRWNNGVKADGDKDKTTMETSSNPTQAPEPETTLPDAAEVNNLPYDKQLLQAELTKNGFDGIKIDGTHYLPQAEGRRFVDAPSTPFDDKDTAESAASKLFEELKVSPIMENNLMIALHESKFFADYLFVDDYFKAYVNDEGYLQIWDMIEKDGTFKPERNVKTLQALTILKSYNTVKIVEGKMTSKAVRLDTKKYFAGSGYDLNGIKVDLIPYSEAKEFRKYLVLEYCKKDGSRCEIYIDWYDKAYVDIYIPKPTSTPTPSQKPRQEEKKVTSTPKPTAKVTATPTPTEIPDEKKITGTPKQEKKITATPKPTQKVTPTPTPIITTTPTPTPIITPTPTVKPKDPSKGTQSENTKPGDDPGPGEYTGGNGVPINKSTKEEEHDSTDFKDPKDVAKETQNNQPEPTTAVTPIVTEVPICGDESGKTVPIQGMIDDEGNNPATPGIAPIDAGTPVKDKVNVDGKDLKNDEDNPADRVGPPAD